MQENKAEDGDSSYADEAGTEDYTSEEYEALRSSVGSALPEDDNNALDYMDKFFSDRERTIEQLRLQNRFQRQKLKEVLEEVKKLSKKYEDRLKSLEQRVEEQEKLYEEKVQEVKEEVKEYIPDNRDPEEVQEAIERALCDHNFTVKKHGMNKNKDCNNCSTEINEK
ncbi:MAG: hypothetical protein ACLFTY_03825 [Candidatus Aenigmatarchaeota archaeon]